VPGPLVIPPFDRGCKNAASVSLISGLAVRAGFRSKKINLVRLPLSSLCVNEPQTLDRKPVTLRFVKRYRPFRTLLAAAPAGGRRHNAATASLGDRRGILQAGHFPITPRKLRADVAPQGRLDPQSGWGRAQWRSCTRILS